MKKRILSIFMALTMGLATVPVTALAAETDWTDYVVWSPVISVAALALAEKVCCQ